jgi:2,3-bisphosphoglycerate-dependent phosphoglycerate mutase
VLVRHGATTWNTEGRFTTRTDVELSPEGVEQAEAAARGFATVAVDRVICSPLRRAAATGEAIAAAAPGRPPVTIDERLREIDAGPFEGLTGPEIEAGPLAAAFHRWRSETDPVWPDGAEPYESAVARARSFFSDVRHLPGTTVAATHGSLARVLVTAILLGVAPGLHRRMWLDHCHCVVVALDESPPRLTALNVAARNIGV